METATVARLVELNRAFYTEHGLDFAESRPRPKPGMQRVLAQIPPGAAVLEVGCGDGQVARTLATAGPHTYFGLDFSPTLLERARELTAEFERRNPKSSEIPGAERRGQIQNLKSEILRPASITFLLADLTSPYWPLPAESFHWALAFSVLQHLPGRETRAEFMRALATQLRPGGWLGLSAWRYDRSPRRLGRRLAWEEVGLTGAGVEPGDDLLAWERAGRAGLRYVHWLDAAEIRALAAGAGLAIRETFQSDGHTGDLADYTLLQKSG